MVIISTPTAADPNGTTPDPGALVYAVSLLAALEEVATRTRHHRQDHVYGRRDAHSHTPATNEAVLAYLGMARAELVDYGQHLPPGYLDVRIEDLGTGLDRLDRHLTRMLHRSQILQHTLRLEAALRWVRRGRALAS